MNIKSYFPILNDGLIYLDNASTTQKPKILIDSLAEYYYGSNSNIGRSVYNLAAISEDKFLFSINTIKEFLGTDNELVFSDGCTSSLNEAAFYVQQIFNFNKQYIILSTYEHHSNLLPWQNFANKNNLKIYWIKTEEELINPYNIPQDILNNTGLISICQISNVTGEINNLNLWQKISNEFNILFCVDGAQGISSIKNPLKLINPDFYTFSAHKYYGPMGLGFLVINKKHLNSLTPYKLGGGIIEDVTIEKYTLLNNESKFNAGTPNIANLYAFAKTILWLKELNISSYQKPINDYLHNSIKLINGINIIELSKNLEKTNICSFEIKGIHAHDIGTFLSNKNIAVRVGKHCTYPLHYEKNIKSSTRISLGCYNTENDIDTFVKELLNCIKFFNG